MLKNIAPKNRGRFPARADDDKGEVVVCNIWPVLCENISVYAANGNRKGKRLTKVFFVLWVFVCCFGWFVFFFLTSWAHLVFCITSDRMEQCRGTSVVVLMILKELKLLAFKQCFQHVWYGVQYALQSECLIFLCLSSELAAVTEKRDSGGSELTALSVLWQPNRWQRAGQCRMGAENRAEELDKTRSWV